ncbi:MAG: hypothetical protein KatS3mg043_1611 [Rhodothermaceae bacterium]|nr:MAG: hypothetical protein KatS3mg043_1611 [Rhodothermaceae bacterium]
MKRSLLLAALALSLSAACVVYRMTRPDPLVSTFSIVAFDPETGDLGVAVQSKFPNVRPIVPWAKAGVGAVATQSFAELDYGIKGLELMENGATAEEALRILLRDDADRQQRQVGMVDARGNAAMWTGTEAFAWAGGRVGRQEGPPLAGGPEQGNNGTVLTGYGYTAQGNILVSKETVEAMAETFERTGGSLADRLVAALVAGGKAGGDQRGEQSAALLVVRQGAGYDGMDNFIDISVYDHPTPIAELERLYRLNNLYFTGSKPENMIPVTEEIARELQQIWQARGFYDGPLDGVVDEEFQRILVDYMGWENYDLRIPPVRNVDLAAGDTLKIDREVLEDIRAVFREGRWKPRLR